MFDCIKYKGKVYQTKDLDCCLDDFWITEDGRLLHNEWHLEEVPKSERPYPNEPEDSILSMAGSFKRVIDKENVEVTYSGIITFYTNDKNTGWEEYDAKFENGKILSITKV